MASEIKVDTIVNAGGDNDTGIDLATNDQILLKVANATKLTMNSTGQTTIVGEGGTTTTSLQQGLCKCWCGWNASSGTPTIDDSFNVASLSDTASGDVNVNFTSNMSNNDYSAPAASTAISFTSVDDRATDKVRTRTFGSGNSFANPASDVNTVMTSLHGELA